MNLQQWVRQALCGMCYKAVVYHLLENLSIFTTIIIWSYISTVVQEISPKAY